LMSLKKYILSKKPKKYLKQGISHCGAYSVKAMLGACGLDTKARPEDYHLYGFNRIVGTTVGKDYYSKILNINGLKAETKTAEDLSEKEKLNLLKKLLGKDTPVMLRIGNGYLNNKYNPIFGKIAGHWITLWGYDDNTQTFYVYDSGLPERYWDKKLPIGNTTRAYQEILRDWNFGRYQFWSWLLAGISRFIYIDLSSN